MTDPHRRATITRGRTGVTGPIGQPVQNPLSELEMDEETALYVGILEAQLAAYAVNEVKYRTILELITGESWYSTRVDVDVNLLGDLATDALVRRGMDGTVARTMVNKRIAFGVESEEEAPVQPQPETVVENADMPTRFRQWKRRRQEDGGLPRGNGPEVVATEPISPAPEKPEISENVENGENSSGG